MGRPGITGFVRRRFSGARRFPILVFFSMLPGALWRSFNARCLARPDLVKYREGYHAESFRLVLTAERRWRPRNRAGIASEANPWGSAAAKSALSAPSCSEKIPLSSRLTNTSCSGQRPRDSFGVRISRFSPRTANQLRGLDHLRPRVAPDKSNSFRRFSCPATKFTGLRGDGEGEVSR